MKHAKISTVKSGKQIGQFKFVLHAANGEPVAKSWPESYTTKQKCKQTLKNCFPDYIIKDETLD